MREYKVYGPCEETLPNYQTLNFVENLIKGLQEEDIRNYHIGMFRLWSWLTKAIDGRKKDIVRRMVVEKKLTEEREAALEGQEKRNQEKAAKLEDEEAAFKEANKEAIEEYERYMEEQEKLANQDYGDEVGSEDEEEGANKEPPTLPTFDRREAEEAFDDENPEVVVPPEVVKDVNNDWQLDDGMKDELMNQFLATKTA